MNVERIYCDYAATTPLRPEAASAMREAWENAYNPSSLHAEGRRARALLDAARVRAATALGAMRTEIIFTGGGTEANNLAVLGTMRATARPAHIVASAIEHHAVLRALEHLKEAGIETSLVRVDTSGRVDPREFEQALRPDTALACVMYANNEVGTVQPIAELAAIARRRHVIFHTDAVAAATSLPLDVGALGVDMLSLSAHKFYGPQGVGLLFVRRGRSLEPMLHGGGQEAGRRSGTENVAGIAGLARALELACSEREATNTYLSTLRDRFEAGVRARLAGVTLNAAEAVRLPSVSNLSFAGVEAADILIALDLAGVAVSAGSACTSGVPERSHVLAAMGPAGSPRSGVRFSLGAATTIEQIDRILALLPPLVARLRHAGPVAHSGDMGRVETNRARLEAEA